MILSNREIKDRKEIDEIINDSLICYVGSVDGDKPYVLPFNFAYDGSSIFLHSANAGKFHEVLDNNRNLCITFNIENEVFYRHEHVACSWGMKYKSVIVRGKAEYVNDFDEKVKIMNMIMKKYAGKDDFTFNSPAIKNVKVICIDITEVSGKKYGHA